MSKKDKQKARLGPKKDAKKTKSWYSMDKTAAEVFIYDEIGEWGVTARDFVRELQGLSGDLDLRINCEGGDVGDGMAIYNALRRHDGHITGYIDGVALSMGSAIAMAADTLIMSDTSVFMLHDPYTGLMGSADELRREAEVLDKFRDAMMYTYTEKSGLDDDTVKAMLSATTWLSAAQALEHGFIDEITESTRAAACISKRIANKYSNVPDEYMVVGPARQPIPSYIKGDWRQGPYNTLNEDLQQSAVSDDNTGGHKMPDKKDVGKTDEDVTKAAKAAAVQATSDERKRVTGIKAAFKDINATGNFNALIDDAINSGDTVEEVSKRVAYLNASGAQAKPIGADSRIEAGVDGSDKFKAGVSNAIMARAGIAERDVQNEYNGQTLIELARASLSRAGIRAPGDKMGVVAAAFTHSTSDFPSILADVANKSVLRGFDEAEETFEAWTVKGSLSDFKAMNRVGLTAISALRQVSEGGEYKHVTVGDHGETIQLATYGELFGITRQAIINDDTQSFSSIPRRMGRAARRTIGDIAYSALTTNAAMGDAVALFHANHNNLATGVAAITTDTVQATTAAMMLNKGRDAAATALNIRPKYLLCPVALSGDALTVQTSTTPVTATNTKQSGGVKNIVANTYETITDARLDAASAVAWYMCADPASHDTIEVAYLDGIEKPFLDEKQGWNVDGVEYKVRIDAAAAPMEYAALYKQAGA